MLDTSVFVGLALGISVTGIGVLAWMGAGGSVAIPPGEQLVSKSMIGNSTNILCLKIIISFDWSDADYATSIHNLRYEAKSKFSGYNRKMFKCESEIFNVKP